MIIYIPKSVKCLSTGYSGDHVHRECGDTARSQLFHEGFILRRVEERDDGAALLKCSNFVDGSIFPGTANFQDDITLRPDRSFID